MVGFCNVEEKLLGPLHVYPVAPAIVLAAKLKVCPVQIGDGLLVLAVGVGGTKGGQLTVVT